MGVAEPHLDAYEGAVRTLLAAGKADAALEVAERARARLLLELMAERDMRSGANSPENQIRQQLREKFAARGDANGKDAAIIDRDIDALTNRLDAIQTSARATDVNAGVRYPASSNAATLQRSLVSGNRALLVYFWGERSVFGWWVTANSIHAARLGSVDSVGAFLDFMRGSLDSPSLDWKPVAVRAFQQLVAPLRPTLADEILVVGDGPLAATPVETFTPAAGAEPWGATSRFIYGPSASVLLALSRARPRTQWTKGILAVGDPTVSGQTTALYREASRDIDLAPLPAAAAEARNVAQLFGGDALVGSNATVQHWLALDPARYRYLHFATHAVLSDRRPEQTSLVMAGGRLDLNSIRHLRLSSELVTLSACETGLGQRLRGEGIIGLPHAFLAAGARGVVVSLWKVEDRTTADYMAEFYKELHSGKTPAGAMLAIRQSRIRSNGPFAHPSKWAPFVLIGGS
jgi:CHAT domain-containing protein